MHDRGNLGGIRPAGRRLYDAGGMSIYQVSCPGKVLFLESEIAELNAISDGGLRVEPALWCELEKGHAGPHCTLAVGARATDDLPARTVWARWPEGDEYGPGREIAALPSCPETFLEGSVSSECCALPKDHEGRHGFEFGPPISESDVMPDWVLRMLEGE